MGEIFISNIIYKILIFRSYIQTSQTISTNRQIIYGPYRVNPGRLSVSRTIGDAQAKL